MPSTPKNPAAGLPVNKSMAGSSSIVYDKQLHLRLVKHCLDCKLTLRRVVSGLIQAYLCGALPPGITEKIMLDASYRVTRQVFLDAVEEARKRKQAEKDARRQAEIAATQNVSTVPSVSSSTTPQKGPQCQDPAQPSPSTPPAASSLDFFATVKKFSPVQSRALRKRLLKQLRAPADKDND